MGLLWVGYERAAYRLPAAGWDSGKVTSCGGACEAYAQAVSHVY